MEINPAIYFRPTQQVPPIEAGRSAQDGGEEEEKDPQANSQPNVEPEKPANTPTTEIKPPKPLAVLTDMDRVETSLLTKPSPAAEQLRHSLPNANQPRVAGPISRDWALRTQASKESDSKANEDVA